MPPVRPAWKRWLIDSAIARIIIFVAITIPLGLVLSVAFGWLGWVGNEPSHPLKLASGVLVRVVPPVTAYLLIVLAIERRRPAELAWHKLLPHGALGFAAGALYIAVVITLLWAAGAYRVDGTSSSVQWARALLIPGLATAILEEIVFRGLLFRLVDEAYGLLPALAVSALFFGGAHIGNPGATLWTSIAIAVEAGILFGVLYHVTQSLPLCMGVHMGWNFTQGAVFGSAVSGTSTGSWLKGSFTGPEWLTGGAFGVEGSVVTVLLGLAISGTLYLAHRRRPAHNATVPAEALPC
ncbi:MAG: CPBP family intramembrane metalloprotease [Burkholderiales bacterium]|nr:CPBP family intramembrane metalloprotease [Burkholderiales bacterium]